MGLSPYSKEPIIFKYIQIGFYAKLFLTFSSGHAQISNFLTLQHIPKKEKTTKLSQALVKFQMYSEC